MKEYKPILIGGRGAGDRWIAYASGSHRGLRGTQSGREESVLVLRGVVCVVC